MRFGDPSCALSVYVIGPPLPRHAERDRLSTGISRAQPVPFVALNAPQAEDNAPQAEDRVCGRAV
jgi:hypothetical protein